MPTSRRVITYVGIVLQAYAVYAMLMWAFVLPKGLAIYLLALPKGPVGYVSTVLVYSIGLCIQNGMLTSEFVRKTQLETDQIAARQIHQTLQRGKLEELPGYELQAFYNPLREVGGGYFDVIELPATRMLFALATIGVVNTILQLTARNNCHRNASQTVGTL